MLKKNVGSKNPPKGGSGVALSNQHLVKNSILKTIKKLQVSKDDILIVIGENSSIHLQRLRQIISKVMGFDVFIIGLKKESEIIKLSPEMLDGLGLKKKD